MVSKPRGKVKKYFVGKVLNLKKERDIWTIDQKIKKINHVEENFIDASIVTLRSWKKVLPPMGQ